MAAATSLVDVLFAYSTGLVAFVLALSAVAKLHSGSTPTLASMTALRVPAPLRARSLARVLPYGELFFSLGFLFAPGAVRTAFAIAVAILLTIFSGFMIGVLARRENVSCNCFGTLQTHTQVTVWSLARNGVLIAAAAGTAYFGIHLGTFVSELTDDGLALAWATVPWWLLTAVVILASELKRARKTRPAPPEAAASHAQTVPAPLSPISLALGIDPERPGEVAVGKPIPHVELVADNGVTQPLAQLANGNPVLLIFVSADCSSCTPVAAKAPQWNNDLAPIRVRIATSSSPEAIAALHPDLAPLARYGAQAAVNAIGVQRSPAAILLGGDNHPIVGSPIAYGIYEIDALVSAIQQTQSVRTETTRRTTTGELTALPE